MKLRLVLSTFLILPFAWFSDNNAFSQSVPDSIQTGKSSLEVFQTASTISDSLILEGKNKLGHLDSLQNSLQQNNPVDRLNNQLDSIQNTFNKRADSLMSAYSQNIGKLDSLKASLSKELDSLTDINISGNQVVEKLDSLAKLQSRTTGHFETKLQDIKDQATSKIARLNLPPEVSEKAKVIAGNINGATIPNAKLKIPGLGSFENPLKKLHDFGKVGELKGLNPSDVAGEIGNLKMPEKFDGVDQLSDVTGNLSDVGKVSDQLNGYASETGQLPDGNVNGFEYFSKVAEAKATEISGIKEIEKQTESLDKYKEMLATPPDPDSLKSLAITQVTQVAVNHFAGKEQQLQEAMQTLAKYKRRYASIPSISELPKKRRNEMRDKPLIERIVPGIALQIQKEGDDSMIDFNAYAAYRFTGKINAGIGWNQRIAYNTDNNGFNPDRRIFGPRTFVEYNLRRGFSPRAELEVMNTNVPVITGSDPLQREWVWGAFVGLKKDYRFFKNIKGTALVMTRLINPDHKSPYADVLNVRFGFEFPMKRKNSKKSSR